MAQDNNMQQQRQSTHGEAIAIAQRFWERRAKAMINTAQVEKLAPTQTQAESQKHSLTP
jgi:hypothetical protein